MIKLKAKLVKPAFSLNLQQDSMTITEYIIEQLKGIDIKNLKLDPDFIKYLCELIENQVSKKPIDEKEKPNKMNVLLDIVKKLFPNISNDDLKNVENIAEFMLKNNLVKKITLTKVMSFYLKKKFSISS
jgi:hypothetical protein